jgi:hypothetical protein
MGSDCAALSADQNNAGQRMWPFHAFRFHLQRDSSRIIDEQEVIRFLPGLPVSREQSWKMGR